MILEVRTIDLDAYEDACRGESIAFSWLSGTVGMVLGHVALVPIVGFSYAGMSFAAHVGFLAFGVIMVILNFIFWSRARDRRHVAVRRLFGSPRARSRA
jgi:hypothetical protein